MRQVENDECTLLGNTDVTFVTKVNGRNSRISVLDLHHLPALSFDLTTARMMMTLMVFMRTIGPDRIEVVVLHQDPVQNNGKQLDPKTANVEAHGLLLGALANFHAKDHQYRVVQANRLAQLELQVDQTQIQVARKQVVELLLPVVAPLPAVLAQRRELIPAGDPHDHMLLRQVSKTLREQTEEEPYLVKIRQLGIPLLLQELTITLLC